MSKGLFQKKSLPFYGMFTWSLTVPLFNLYNAHNAKSPANRAHLLYFFLNSRGLRQQVRIVRFGEQMRHVRRKAEVDFCQPPDTAVEFTR